MTIKISYFNIRGLGELSRLLLELSGAPYEDTRVEFADWPALKATSAFGQLPVYEDEKVNIAQSNAIARHIARKFGNFKSTDLVQSC